MHTTARTHGPIRRHCMVVFGKYPLTETRVQREAAALVAAGYAVDVICGRDGPEPLRDRDGAVEIHRLPMRYDKAGLSRQLVGYLDFLVRATIRLARLHLRHPYACIQVHNLPDFLVFCALVPKLLGAKVVLDLHDLMPEFYAGRFGAGDRGAVGRLIRAQERLACRFADHVITVSEHWRRALVERGVDARKCTVVMNVADERIFSPTRPPARGARPGFHLLYHGTVAPRCGLDLAIRAVAEVRDDVPGVRLTIIGRGPYLEELRRLAEELHVEREVRLGVPFVPLEDLPAVIGAADVGLVPNRNDVFTDGIVPTKLMEYAAMGIPCIASRTTAIAAYFSGANVELFEPGDVDDLARCIRKLWRDPAYRAELARRSATFTDRYSWARLGREYVDLVEGLAAR